MSTPRTRVAYIWGERGELESALAFGRHLGSRGVQMANAASSLRDGRFTLCSPRPPRQTISVTTYTCSAFTWPDASCEYTSQVLHVTTVYVRAYCESSLPVPTRYVDCQKLFPFSLIQPAPERYYAQIQAPSR